MSGARLVLLTAVAIAFFAANSLLTRGALAEGAIGAGHFAVIRLTAGTVVLVALVLLSGRRLQLAGPSRLVASMGLFAYMVGFSLAYVWLDAGLGALILFAGVQATMFAGGVLGGERVPLLRWLGMGIAMVGLGILFLPQSDAAPDPLAAVLMAAAALGFGLYSLAGKRSTRPLEDTAVNFALAAAVALVIPWGMFDPTPTTWPGVALAVVSGAVTSGLGYALWYALLPHLGATRAAVAQLTAPVLALLGGALILGEALGVSSLLAAAVILGGVLVAVIKR